MLQNRKRNTNSLQRQDSAATTPTPQPSPDLPNGNKKRWCHDEESEEEEEIMVQPDPFAEFFLPVTSENKTTKQSGDEIDQDLGDGDPEVRWDSSSHLVFSARAPSLTYNFNTLGLTEMAASVISNVQQQQVQMLNRRASDGLMANSSKPLEERRASVGCIPPSSSLANLAELLNGVRVSSKGEEEELGEMNSEEYGPPQPGL